MREIAVAVSIYNENVTPIQTINAIKVAGFTNVFVYWFGDNPSCTKEKQLSYIREQGLNVIFAHLGYENINSIWEPDEKGDLLVLDYLKDLDECSQNNIPMVVMHLSTPPRGNDYNEIGQARIKKIVDYAESLGIKIAFENTRIGGYLEPLLANIPNENVGLCYDAGHNHVGINDKIDLSVFKNRIIAVHLHGNDTSSDQHLLPFDGTINWEDEINKLIENGYDGPITLEIVYAGRYTNISLTEYYKEAYRNALIIALSFEDKDKNNLNSRG